MSSVIDTGRQRALFERIHEEYERHYYDRWSMKYRRRYIYGPMFRGLNLNRADVADLASGSGHTSLAILERFPAARPVGYDISGRACDDYRQRVGRDAFRVDLTKPWAEAMGPNARFDFAVIVGGIHHCVADLPTTLDNIASMLRPGGWLLMMEPSRQFMLDIVRRLWYRLDREHFDAETEAALKHDELLKIVGSRFRLHDVVYRGGPAYFFVLSSMLLRVPQRLKPLLAPVMFGAEEIYRHLRGRWWFPFFIARWRRTESSAT